MRVAEPRRLRMPGFLLALILLRRCRLSAQEKPPAEWDTTKARGQTRRHRFRYQRRDLDGPRSITRRQVDYLRFARAHLPHARWRWQSRKSYAGLRRRPQHAATVLARRKNHRLHQRPQRANNLWLMDVDGRILVLFLPIRRSAPFSHLDARTHYIVCSVRAHADEGDGFSVGRVPWLHVEGDAESCVRLSALPPPAGMR